LTAIVIINQTDKTWCNSHGRNWGKLQWTPVEQLNAVFTAIEMLRGTLYIFKWRHTLQNACCSRKAFHV